MFTYAKEFLSRRPGERSVAEIQGIFNIFIQCERSLGFLRVVLNDIRPPFWHGVTFHSLRHGATRV